MSELRPNILKGLPMSSKEFNGFSIVVKSHYHSIMRDDSTSTECSDSRGKKSEFMDLTTAIDYLHNLLEDKNKKLRSTIITDDTPTALSN